ncbi:murein biosynthesis integral membrane protein MurJ [Sulfobacillus harzensis]|uniref:Probable lipid II flippase MurJ n=1 Tax=Sulfobacillus harzensis TaxID=2729629 RepID=A0A7Y0L3I3_9FIRM|nr:murein biosynthesis integral membrane protein MurJ [Sulfobacillus harzensis]NMP22540.1 murein biosynthesis integral membrane protein MurJ [Sulfobacillus harzensis]
MPDKRTPSIGRSATLVFGFNLISKLGGFIRQFAMALMFGTGMDNDAWLIASALPNLLFGAIGGAITSTVVPLLAEARARVDDAWRQAFIQQAFWSVLAIGLAISAVAELLAPILIHLLAPGFHGRKLVMAVSMARVVLPTLMLQTTGGVLSGILQESDQYAAPASVPALTNLIRIVGIVLLSRLMALWGSPKILGVAVGFTLATVSQFAILLPGVRRAGVRLRVPRRFDHPLLGKMGRMALPYILNFSASSIEVVIDRVLSSYLVVGSIAAINYSYTLVQVPLTMFLNPLITPLLTRLSQFHARAEHGAFRRLSEDGLGVVWMLLAPITVWFVMLRVPILNIIFQHGAFNARSTALTSKTLLAFGLGLPGFGMVLYFRNLFFAQRDTRYPAIFGLIAVACNIAGDLTLVHPLQAEGLSLSTSIANWINAILLASLLYRRGVLQWARVTRLAAPVASGLAIMAGALWGLMTLLPFNPHHRWLTVMDAVLWVAVSGILYLGVLKVMRFSSLDLILSRLKRRVPGLG